MIKNKKIEHDLILLIKKLKADLRKDSSILFVYIFGSYGQNKSRPLSDIDIAVYLAENLDVWTKKLELIERITKILKTDEVDLVICNEASLFLNFQVLKTGKLLFSNNEIQRIAFVRSVYNTYCDTELLRKTARSNLLTRMKEGRIDRG